MVEVTESDVQKANEAFDIAFSADPEGIDKAMTALFATHRQQAAKAQRDRMDAAYLEAFDVHMSLIVTNWPKIKHVPTAIALAAKTMDAMVSFQTLRELPDDVADKAFDLARVELPLMEYRVLRVVATALADALESQP